MGDPYSRISVTVDGAHHLVVGYRNCGERVQEVRVVRASGGAKVWLLKGDPGSTAGHFTSGNAVPGMTTVVPLPDFGSGDYEVSIITNERNPGTLSFSESELSPSIVVWDRGAAPKSEFDAMTDEDLGCTK
jgi:hypothetical protein